MIEIHKKQHNLDKYLNFLTPYKVVAHAYIYMEKFTSQE